MFQGNVEPTFVNVDCLQAAEMAASQEKQMEVCEICGAFLIVGDAQQRIDDHLTGKQHMGFAKLRDAIKEIKDVSALLNKLLFSDTRKKMFQLCNLTILLFLS